MTKTHRRSVRGRLRWLRVPVLAAAAIFAATGPAGATGVTQGSGAAVGYSTVSATGSGLPICLAASGDYRTTIAAGQAAAVNGVPTTGTYAGQLDLTITLPNTFWFNPAGVFSNASCTTPGVSATITVTSTGTGQGSLSCTGASGTFGRVNSTIAFVSNPLSPGSCTVSGVTVPAVHTFVGNEYPCLTDPFTETSTCPSPLDTAHVVGVWTMAGAAP